MNRAVHFAALPILFVLAGNSTASAAVTIDDFELRTFTASSADTVQYRLMIPANYDSSKSYPLVMFLHGGQQRGKLRWTAATLRGARFCGDEERQAKHPCFVLVAHAPISENWGSVFEGGPSPTLLNFMEALDALETEFNIDKRREYITGLSGGGKGTWIAFLSHPGRFAAAIPLCARQALDPTTADLSRNAGMVGDLPIWMWHGEKDPSNEVENSRLMFQALKKVGANVKYTEVPNAPHNCWDAAYSTDELHDWLFEQVLPESVSTATADRDRRRDAVLNSNPFPTVAYHPTGFIPKSYEHPSRGKLNYRLFVPREYDASRSYPIIIFLHGKSRRGSDNLKQINTPGAANWTAPGFSSKNPAFVLAPQAPADSGWGCPAILPEMMDPLQNVIGALEQVEQKYNINKRRVYITGQSGGGGGASALVMAHPDRFAAAVLVCPANRAQNWTKQQAAKIAHLPLWFFHGDADQVVDVNMTRTAVALLKEAGGSPHYTELPNVKHNSWEKAYRSRAMRTWLFQQRKEQ